MEKTFTSYVKNTKIYTLVVAGLAGSVSWAGSIIVPTIVMVASFIATLKIIATIRIPKIVVATTDNLIKFTIYFINSINVRTINIVGIMRQTMRFLGNIIEIPTILVTGVLHQILRIINATIRIPKIILTGVMTVAVFYLLSTYDPQYFYDLDSRTLASMDYTV